MAKMLAIRLHLDESHETNGPLRVIPGSHAGRVPFRRGTSNLEAAAKCCLHSSTRWGDTDAPVVVHASSSSSKPEPRRVIHLEFAADELPNGLEWHDQVW